MRPFEVTYLEDYQFVTEWMSDTQEGFELLRCEVKALVPQYLAFITTHSACKGVHIEYYHLDSDDFGNGEVCDDVVKWRVSLSPRKEGLTEELKGLSPHEKYTVIDVKTSNCLLEGDFDTCLNHIKSLYPQFDYDSDADIAQLTENHVYMDTMEYDHIELKTDENRVIDI